MSTEIIVPFVVCCLALAIASAVDWRTLRIYNWLTAPLFLSGVIYHSYVTGMDGAMSSIFAGVGAFVAMLFLYVLGAMGAGDVKLAAGLGAWLGLPLTLMLLSVGLLVSAAISILLLLKQGRVEDTWLNLKLAFCRISMIAHHVSRDDQHERIHEIAKTAEGRRRLVPFSVMLAVGMILLLTYSLVSAA